MTGIYVIIKNLSFLSFVLSLFMVCFLDVNCNEGGAVDYFGQNQELKTDVSQYLHALEIFDKSNSSFDELTTSIKNLFKYIDQTRQDELTSVLYAFPKLRPDIFPLVEERRINQKGFATGKSHVIIRRKDETVFMIFPSRCGVEWMFQKIEFGKKQIMWKGIPDPIKDLIVVQLQWQKSQQFKNNRTLIAEYRWGELPKQKDVLILTQEFKPPEEEE